MCGIVGFWGSNETKDIDIIIDSMSKKIISRGPDAFGHWNKKEIGLAIGHRRLSIIDTSANGAQPMISKSKRYVISYNGEIYNHLDIRKMLKDTFSFNNWKGSSDTETLLVGIELYGLQKMLEIITGMFSFALWDSDKEELTLVRDRIGEKPVYYGRENNTFLFGSELKSLLNHPSWEGKIDRDSLSLFMQYSTVPGDYCIYKNFYKLKPGHYIVVSNRGSKFSNQIKYWSLNTNFKNTESFTFEESKTKLNELLSNTISKQMIADVPVGCFLSGGIDSSLVTSIMQNNSIKPIKTFTIGFNEKKFNEAEYAKKISNHLKTDHTELYIEPLDLINIIPMIPKIWDEPLADSSQIPTYLVSKVARSNVKVSLSGDGGDEIFCGYNRYVRGYDVWKKIRNLPEFFQKFLGLTINKIPNNIYKVLDIFLQTNYKELLPKLSRAILSNNEYEFYNNLLIHWKKEDNLVLNTSINENYFTKSLSKITFSDFRQTMMFLDLHSYLPDTILTKVDRASMAVSLETREPFLDHRIVEFGFNLPLSYKVKNGKSKYILRELLKDYLPTSYFERPKQGFSIPLAKWLREELREWAESLLNEKKLMDQGYLNPKLVRDHWKNCLNENKFSHYKIWNVLMFQSWLETINK